MNRALVAAVVAVIYLPSGRHVDETTIDAWQFALDDIEDGEDVLPVVRQLTRQQGGFVRADEVAHAVGVDRERAARAAEYQRAPEAIAVLEAAPPRWDYDEPKPETNDEWLAFARRRLAAARGPLAAGLRAVMGRELRPRQRRVDEEYFAALESQLADVPGTVAETTDEGDTP